ncbi:Gamma-tubulin complex component 6 [Paramuricea clavata]|uniref:Gamma-tubulin complex component 6 n=1 Tax=Paramuricea clavata TaxID=317549 RepID=A0A6S7FNL0_PARCT|nr:Gamma-tubulin complex component 6 [Paramuricea clavata]
MEINIPQDAITSLVDKLSEKIFTEEHSVRQNGPFKVHFNKKIVGLLRKVAFDGLLSKQDGGFVETEQNFNVKERLCIVGYKLKAYGLASKANLLEKLVSSLDFNVSRSSVYTGHLDVVSEVEAVVKILLALSKEAEMLSHDPCEVWRKVDPCYQISLNDQTSLSLDSGIVRDHQIEIDYQYFPTQIFEASPTFGIPRRGFESGGDSLQFNIFNQEPGSCGLTKWFGSKVTEDEGFEDASDGLSTSSTFSDDSGTHGLEIWDEALKSKPSRFFTWEGRKQIISKACKPYLTEAGSEIVNYLCDMRMAEACFLINSQPETLRYLHMTEFIRDCLMLLIGVPSQTFQLEKSTGSFHVSTTVRLSGCSPDALQKTLTELAKIGTNYFRLNKFTTCQRHSTLTRSSVLRAFINGLKTCLQKYRQFVITVQASRVQSVLDLSTKFREQAYELKFLSDICMCSQGFAAEYGKPKPKFPMGAKLLTYLYELCLRNMNSNVINLLLYLLKVSCTPYLRFIQQWVFKGRCVDLYKEFMIFENDVYLAYRDKHYWTNGYIMSGTDKMEGVPIFLKELSKNMFICGKSINLLKLCCPEHYICNHNVEIPVMAVVYSLSSLQRISDSSREYSEKMRKLQENIQLEWRRKENEEIHKQERLTASERKKANKALAEIEELVEKAKKALTEKKKEELNFLKQQMEDAINRKELETKQAAAEDARLVRESLRYEVTTARVDDQIAEQARQELIHYYEELSREAERREKHAVWLASRHALKHQRDTFLEEEKDKLDQMRNEITKKLASDRAQNVLENTARKKWDTSNELQKSGVKNELSGNNSSSVQDLIYNSDSVVDSRKTLPRIGQAMQSTAQAIMYPDMVPSTGDDGGSQKSGDSMHGHVKVTRATDSTIQDLMYHTSRKGVVTGPDGIADDGDATALQPTTTTGVHGTKTLTRAMDSTAQNLLYHSSEQAIVATPGGVGKIVTRAMGSTAEHLIYHSDQEKVVTSSSSRGDGSKCSGSRTMTRAMDSTAQNLLYHSSDEQMVPYKSSRGVGSAFQSTVEKEMYGDGGTRTVSNRSFEPSGNMKAILYGHDVNVDSQATTSKAFEQPSVMKDILYPETNQSDVVGGQMRSTRGSAPPSTIQNLMYRSASITEEPEKPARQPLTHEDVWLDAQFESLPDNFDILDDEPFGDIFARVMLDHPGSYHESDGILDDDLDGENDACDVLCLPVILQRCVLEPLTTQIKVVNSAVVSYFMDNLKLVGHFETLKKFLLMEDGEFSYSLTQQLFEKISSGVTPQQLCCISTLNSIMAQSIQSSVYACQSENTRSLSFVLKSIPDIFKRNDVKVLDFLELRYKIQWPVNIIVTENCITKYNRIFAFMLRLKRTAWILQDIRYSLKRMDKSASKSPQLRKIHLFRHEMSHFVNDVQGYISNQILHVSWQEFLNSLEHNVIITKLVNRGYQPHLEELLLRLNFNSYYGKNISSHNSPTFEV